MADTNGGYDDSNRAFLQAFLARGTLTFEEAKPILAGIFTVKEGQDTHPNDVTQEDFNSYIAAADEAISRFDYSIRSTLSQHDRTRIFALINTTSDAMTQLATTHSADEISFLKRLLDAMFETYNTQRQEVMAITSMQAVRLHKPSGDRRQSEMQSRENGTQAGEGQALTMAGAEKMLKDLVREGWLEKNKADFYSLSARALIELKHYLLTTYNTADDDDEQDEEEGRQDKIKLCAACKEIVTLGQRCPKKECQGRLHNICADGFFRVQRSQTCPVCKRSWSGHGFVGEKAVTTTEAYLKGRRRSGGGRRSTATEREEADEEDEDE
ncbi:MAG: hypothetical protein M1823_000530 [Watsoniomyces obsoletus]|nr:MAG: hypothetical protein M1823_000530 [Watsoniomyces obsoletus]